MATSRSGCADAYRRKAITFGVRARVRVRVRVRARVRVRVRVRVRARVRVRRANGLSSR